MARTRGQERQSSVDSVELPKRTSRKRRASDSSEVSLQIDDTPSLSQQTQNKRRKKFSRAVREESSQPLQDVLEVCEGPEGQTTEAGASTEEQQSKRVHFSETHHEDAEKATASSLTPHIKKTTIHRRITLSPQDFDTPRVSQDVKSRTSLPAIRFSPNSPAISTQEFTMVPLKQRLEEIRVRQRQLAKRTRKLQRLRAEIHGLEEHAQTLEQELSGARERSDRKRAKAIEIELTQLREQIKAKEMEETASLPQLDGSDDIEMLANGDEDDDENFMVLGSQMDAISYPQLPAQGDQTPLRITGEASDVETIAEVRTQALVGDPKLDAEREAFEKAIKHWAREASDAKAALEVLTIELQTLGFGGSEVTTEVILKSIRDSFTSVRDTLQAALPEDVPEDVTNGELVELVTDRLRLLAEHTRDLEQTVTESEELRKELAKQIDGLVERLSRAKTRKSQLEINFNELDTRSQEDERYIAELEASVKHAQEFHEKIQTLVTEREAELASLRGENAELEKNAIKLSAAIEGYRKTEENLQTLITRMEEEHNAVLTKMEDTYQKSISNIEGRLDEEMQKRETAEADADEKQTTITDLEIRFEEAERNIEELKQQLSELQAEKATEQEAREAAELDRNDKNEFITELEAKVESAESELADLSEQLEELRKLSDTERRQREAAENDLDEANNKIADLDARLHQQGTQANELRQKLFEIQMREKETMKQMEAAATEKEEQFQDDMAAEIARREQAESTAADRNITISQLEEQLRNLEETMQETIQDRESTITEQAARANGLERDVEDLRGTLDVVRNEYEQIKEDSRDRIADLEDTVAELRDSVANHVQTIKDLQEQARTTAELHASAIDDRDTKIAALNHDMFTAHSDIKRLEAEKASLERRVESEAEQMLELQANKDDEIAVLKSIISEKHAEIQDMITKAKDVDAAWNGILLERDSELAELKVSMEQSTVSVEALIRENAELKARFKKYIRDAEAATEAQRKEFERALYEAGQKEVALRQEGKVALDEIEAMNAVAEVQTTKIEKHATIKSLKKSKAKRTQDSGVGLQSPTSA